MITLKFMVGAARVRNAMASTGIRILDLFILSQILVTQNHYTGSLTLRFFSASRTKGAYQSNQECYGANKNSDQEETCAYDFNSHCFENIMQYNEYN